VSQIKFLNYFSMVGIISTFLFALVHLNSGSKTVGYFEIVGVFLAIVNVLYFRLSLNYRLASFMLLFLMTILLVFLLVTGGFQGTGIYWFYTFPALAFFLKGKLHGFFYLLFLYLAVITGYSFHHYGLLSSFYYNFTEIRQLLSSLTAVSLLMYYYEKTKLENEMKIKQNEKEIVMKNIFDRQFEEAGEIQRTYIPQNTHHSEFMQISGYYKPAMEIGGDYFDIFPLNNNRTGAVICDVSSKGIPAALIMVKFRTMIKMMYDINSLKPSQVFSFLNKIIANEIVGHMFITSIYLIINQDTGEIEFANAGHLPMTIYSLKDKKIKTIHSVDLPVGISQDQSYKDHNMKVEPGDVIVLYTDGINEMENQQEEMYGRERLHAQIIKYSAGSAKEISENLIKDLFHYSKGCTQKDDIALVVIKIL